MHFYAWLMLATAITVSGVFAMGPAPQQHKSLADRGKASQSAIAVIDGDTIEVDGETIRLAGIDAPEIGQPCDDHGRLTSCGRDAAFALKKLVDLANASPTCEKAAGKDASTCWIGGTDLAETLLINGHATALNDAPLRYRLAEKRARDVPLGIWKGQFASPAAWRNGERLPLEREVAQAAKETTELPWRIAGVQILPEPITHRDPCVIKAVVSSAAGRQYAGPLDPGYAEIDATAPIGRTFCSVDEARRAGWRHLR